MLQSLPEDIVSNAFSSGQVPPISASNSNVFEDHIHPASLPTMQPAPIDKSDAILAYLQKLDQSNLALSKHVMELESSRSVASTPHNVRTRPIMPSLAHNLTLPFQLPVVI